MLTILPGIVPTQTDVSVRLTVPRLISSLSSKNKVVVTNVLQEPDPIRRVTVTLSETPTVVLLIVTVKLFPTIATKGEPLILYEYEGLGTEVVELTLNVTASPEQKVLPAIPTAEMVGLGVVATEKVNAGVVEEQASVSIVLLAVNGKL